MILIECDNCKNKFNRKESEVKKYSNSYCSRECSYIGRQKREAVECVNCGLVFEVPSWQQRNKPRKFCSHKCSNESRKGITYTGEKCLSKPQRRLLLLESTFNFSCCMVEGCKYNRTYDVHRLIEGKYGGKYEIGNMFAICPNHHAEVHRGIITLEKLSNYSLRVIDNG